MIVGGGPAGISTWLHLQRYAPELAGFAVVIEKAVFPRDKLCAGGVGGWSADVLQHLEIELDLPSLFVSDAEFRFCGETFHLHRPNFFRVVQRTDFDHFLAKTAVHRGLELHQGEMLIDVVRGTNGLKVITDKKEYRVKILIGADGALSAVRRKMTSHQLPRLAPTIEFFAPADPKVDAEFHEKKMVLDLTPIAEGLQGYVWHIPCLKSGFPSIAHGICDFRIHRDKPRADLVKIFSRELQSRNIHPVPESWSSHPISWLSTESHISEPHLLLVGDAAGIEPAFGGGIHIALSYGEIAALEIIHAFQHNDFSFKDYAKRVHSHTVGQWINECTRLAAEMYAGRMNPLDVARALFAQGTMPAHLLRQMLSEVAKALRTV